MKITKIKNGKIVTHLYQVIPTRLNECIFNKISVNNRIVIFST